LGENAEDGGSYGKVACGQTGLACCGSYLVDVAGDGKDLCPWKKNGLKFLH